MGRAFFVCDTAPASIKHDSIMANDNSSLPSLVPGRATLQGTEHYTEKFAELHPSHFRLCHSLFFSSIGLGTYLGAPTDQADAAYTDSIIRAVGSGCNVMDSAINYRFQRSERAIGQALQYLFNRGFSREELVICTKGGFISYDGSYPADPYQWVEENLINKGVVTPEEIHPNGHCMSPMYLYHEIAQSRRNLGIDTIDVYYLHNPETQMGELHEVRYYEALEMAFRALEAAVQDGRINMYGIATWDGFHEAPGSRQPMQLERVIECARRAGGERHHFCAVQLPVNLAMPEALTNLNQKVGDQTMTLLEAASALNVCVVASASLLQGSLASNLPVTLRQAIPEMDCDAARAIQFVRSIPGISTALVGMGSPDHVSVNMELAHIPAMSDEQFHVLFGDR